MPAGGGLVHSYGCVAGCDLIRPSSCGIRPPVRKDTHATGWGWGEEGGREGAGPGPTDTSNTSRALGAVCVFLKESSSAAARLQMCINAASFVDMCVFYFFLRVSRHVFLGGSIRED